MKSLLYRFFHLRDLKTTISREVLAGVTTFVSMAYIIVVNPKILEAGGFPFEAAMVATVLSAALGTLLMGVYAKRPFAIAPYMGENAFIAFTVCGVLGYSWQTALGAIFISGLIFTAITLLGLRSWLAKSVPTGLKAAFVLGIGLFLAFVGLNTTGLVTLGVPGAPVHVGDLTSKASLLAISGFLLICLLWAWKVPGAIILSILLTTLAAFFLGIAAPPSAVVSAPPSLLPTLFAMDIPGALTWGMLSVVLTIFVMDFVDTMGTLFALGHRAGVLDQDGEFPDIHKPFLSDASATTLAGLLGTTSTGVFIESATGIEAGGRSGLTACVVALLFLLGLFFTPLATAVPACAYGPSLIAVGMLMVFSLRDLEFNDITESAPAFLTLALMSFTYNIGIGMTAGFVSYPLLKALTGRIREVAGGMWVLFALSLLFFALYPYAK